MTARKIAHDDDGCALYVDGFADGSVTIITVLGVDRIDVALSPQDALLLMQSLARHLHPAGSGDGQREPYSRESSRAVGVPGGRFPPAARLLQTLRGWRA